MVIFLSWKTLASKFILLRSVRFLPLISLGLGLQKKTKKTHKFHTSPWSRSFAKNPKQGPLTKTSRTCFPVSLGPTPIAVLCSVSWLLALFVGCLVFQTQPPPSILDQHNQIRQASGFAEPLKRREASSRILIAQNKSQNNRTKLSLFVLYLFRCT
jgi:hypothetical protein